MLSISNVSPEQGASYFKEDNYYSKEEANEQSQWFGSGAALLGLSGHVESEPFKNLLDGYSPDRRKTLSGKKINAQKHRAGVDLTFSAPKSVSLAALMGGDTRLVQAHRIAVERTLKIVEQQYAQARVWDSLQQRHVNTGNLVVAQFHHTTSREKDPQLHTHCVVLNCTQLENGQWRALTNEELYNNKMLLGAIYRNELAYEARRLGYEIEPSSNELFELKGYTRVQLEWFSKRRQQILELVGPNATAAQKEWATLQTRASKGKELPHEEQLGWWQAQDEAFNIQIQHPIPQAVVQPNEDALAVAALAVCEAIEHCSERTVAFKRKALEKFIFSEIKNFSYAELEQAIANDPELISTFDGRFTTTAAVERELSTINLMQQGRSQVESVANPKTVDDYLKNKTLTCGQQRAIAMSATTTDQFVAWQGVAGAGKTYALNEFRFLAEASGYVLKGFAPSAEAANVLGSEVGIEASTVARLLVSQEPQTTSSNQIWIVDEAGLLSALDAHALLLRAIAQQARVILVGDTRQLSAVEAGNPFKSLQNAGMQTAHLNQSLRQRTPDLQQAVDLIAKSQVEQGIAFLDSANRIAVIPDAQQRLEQLVQDYMALALDERETTLVLAGTNQERLAITQRIRDELKKEGALGQAKTLYQLKPKDLTQVQARYTHHYSIGDVVVPTREYKRLGLTKFQPYQVEALDRNSLTLKAADGTQRSVDPMAFRKTVYTQHTCEIAVGDRLKWTRNDKELGRRNGQEFIVTAIDGEHAEIQYKDGAVDQINFSALHHLDYALVSTTYSSQGKTANRVLVAADHTMGAESFYVAVSRVKYDLKIYTADKAQLLKDATRSKAKENPNDLLGQSQLRKAKSALATSRATALVPQLPVFDLSPTDEQPHEPTASTASTESPRQFQLLDGIVIGRGVSERLNTNSRAARPHRRLGSSSTTSSPRTVELRPRTNQPAASQSTKRIESRVERVRRVSQQWRDVGSNFDPALARQKLPGSNTQSTSTSPKRSLHLNHQQIGAANRQSIPGLATTVQRFNAIGRQFGAVGTKPIPAVRESNRPSTSSDDSHTGASQATQQPKAKVVLPDPRLQQLSSHLDRLRQHLESSTRTDRAVGTQAGETQPALGEPLQAPLESGADWEQLDSELQQLSDDLNALGEWLSTANRAVDPTQAGSIQRLRVTQQPHRQLGATSRKPTPGLDQHLQQLGRVSNEVARVSASLKALNNQASVVSLEVVASELGLQRSSKQPGRWKGAEHQLSIDGNKFYDHQARLGGTGIIRLIMHVRHCSYRKAIDWLTRTTQVSAIPSQRTVSVAPQLQPTFTPPVLDDKHWPDVRRYLIESRSLPEDLIDSVHHLGALYADSKGNAVFLRTDGKGQVTGANLLETSQQRPKFELALLTQQDAGWFRFMQGEGKLTRAVLTQSPMDALSVAALEQPKEKTLYISVDSAKAFPIHALQKFMERGGIVSVAFGADKKGNLEASLIIESLPGATRLTPTQGSDWNKQLRYTRSRQALTEALKQVKAENERYSFSRQGQIASIQGIDTHRELDRSTDEITPSNLSTSKYSNLHDLEETVRLKQAQAQQQSLEKEQPHADTDWEIGD